MKKITPDPPLADPTFADPLLEAQKLKEAADRAIDYYLNPRLIKNPAAPRKPSTLFIVDPAADNETLLVHACESLASASIMASDLAGFIDGPQRSFGCAGGESGRALLAGRPPALASQLPQD